MQTTSFGKSEGDWQLKAERWGINLIKVIVQMIWGGGMVLIKFLRQAVYTFFEAFRK